MTNDNLASNAGNGSGMSEKAASTSEERMRYLKAALVAGIGAAGIGSLIRSIKHKKAKAKAMDMDRAKDAIYVQIQKDKFLDGLPTPKDQRNFGKSKQVEPVQSELQPDLPSQAVGMSADDINARKKAILMGRKFDFFGGGAKKVASDGSEDESPDEKESEPTEKKEVTEEKYDGRIVLRDQSGKFVSPTDPVAVEQVEKKAVDGILDMFVHPIDSLKRMYGAAKDKPVLYTGAAIGGVYLASKIADAINSIRRKHAKEHLKDAKDQYISLLESGESEKTAAFDIRDASGALIGASFVVPLALSAIVTNKIIENRKKEKEKNKQYASSFPDEPIILYKTAEGEELAVRPETMLAMMSIKTDMIKDAEISAGQIWGVKSAASPSVADALKWGGRLAGIRPKGYNGEDLNNPMTSRDAYDAVMTQLEDTNNNQYLANIMKGYGTAGYDPAEDIWNATEGMDPVQRYRLWNSMVTNPKMRDELKGLMSSNERTQKLMLSRMEDPAFADTYQPIVQGRVDSFLTDKENGWGLDKDGILFKIVSWIMNNTGLGNYFAKKYMNNMFYENRANLRNQAAAKAKEQAANAQGASNATVEKQVDEVASQTNPEAVAQGDAAQQPAPADQVENQPPAATQQPVQTPAPAATQQPAQAIAPAAKAPPAAPQPAPTQTPATAGGNAATPQAAAQGGAAPVANNQAPAKNPFNWFKSRFGK